MLYVLIVVFVCLCADVICAKGGPDLTESRGFIKRWLPGSVDRGGGRKRRFAETFAAEQPDDPSLQGCCPLPAHPCPQDPGQSTVDPSCPAAAAPAPSPAAAPAPAPPPSAAAPGAEHPY